MTRDQAGGSRFSKGANMIWRSPAALAFVLGSRLLATPSHPQPEGLEAALTVRLERVVPSEDILADFHWPGIDFEDRGWISRTPLEDLSRLPAGPSIRFYGIFDLSVESIIVGRYGAEAAPQYLWSPPVGLQADSKVSFLNGVDADGDEVFYFDTDNDEDFADESPVHPKDDGLVLSLLSRVLPVPYGHTARADVEFEFSHGESVARKTVTVEVVKYENYISSRAPDNPKFRGEVYELLTGSAVLNGDSLRLAIRNGYDVPTYHNRHGNYALWDLNKDGIFENEFESEEFYRSDKPFNIRGVSLEVRRIDPAGDFIVLAPAEEAVARKREIAADILAPDFSVVDMSGDTLMLSDLRGQHVLLDFWFTTCAPCIGDTPELVSLYDDLHARGLEILGVSTDGSRDAVASYVAENNIAWPQILDRIDNQGKVTELYNIGGFPSYVWIGPDGRVIDPELKGRLHRLRKAF